MSCNLTVTLLRLTPLALSRLLWHACCRCLHTATLVLDGVQSNATNVEEFVRETLGMDTCDARRSVSDPNSNPAPQPQVCVIKDSCAMRLLVVRHLLCGALAAVGCNFVSASG
jgi:hypothetical protein